MIIIILSLAEIVFLVWATNLTFIVTQYEPDTDFDSNNLQAMLSLSVVGVLYLIYVRKSLYDPQGMREALFMLILTTIV